MKLVEVRQSSFPSEKPVLYFANYLDELHSVLFHGLNGFLLYADGGDGVTAMNAAKDAAHMLHDNQRHFILEIKNTEDLISGLRISQDGTKVFGLLPAFDCAEAILRFFEFTRLDFQSVQQLLFVVSPRCLDGLCSHCRMEHTLNMEEKFALFDSELELISDPNIVLYERAYPDFLRNCTVCKDGYYNSVIVTEYVRLSSVDWERLFNCHTHSEIRNLLYDHGCRSVWEQGLRLVMDGIISIKDLMDNVWRGV